MSVRGEPATLVAEIKTSLAVISKIEAFYQEFSEGSLNRQSPTRENRIVLAEILVNYYTALESLFLRVSQAFENNLDVARWHADLLEKMTLEIEGVRPRLISDRTRDALRELMRFRHFKRYYLEFDYDWDKLQFLEKKLNGCRKEVLTEIHLFLDQLRGM
ncbi:MAG: hypothetical protein EA427_16295 [Spirochaetaceae bacterium]|nr:MAG: hypothetical protein EA427_16295 [Spirochaetaceae bacterium]